MANSSYIFFFLSASIESLAVLQIFFSFMRFIQFCPIFIFSNFQFYIVFNFVQFLKFPNCIASWIEIFNLFSEQDLLTKQFKLCLKKQNHFRSYDNFELLLLEIKLHLKNVEIHFRLALAQCLKITGKCLIFEVQKFKLVKIVFPIN